MQTELSEYGDVEELWDAVNADGRPVQALALNAGIGLAVISPGTRVSTTPCA